MSTEERLEKLERELGGMWYWVGALVLVGLVLLMSVLALAVRITQTTPGDGPKVIRANEFRLEDEEGESRARLRVRHGWVSLDLFDEHDTPRASLHVSETGPALCLCDDDGKWRALLRVFGDGPALWLYDEDHKARAVLGVNQTISPDLTLTKHPESSLALMGPDEKTEWSAP